MAARPAPLRREPTPPHSVETEQALIGAFMLDPEAYARAKTTVTAEDFFRSDHQILYSAIAELALRGEPTDPVTVIAELERRGQLDNAGGRGYVAQIYNDTPSAANVRAYAERVRADALRRQMASLAGQFQRDAQGGRDLAELVEEHMRAISELGPWEQRKAAVEPLGALADIRIDDFLDREPEPRQLILENFPLGIVALSAAGGGTGKSMLALQQAVSIATNRPFLGLTVVDPGSVLIIAAEDERDEIHRRLACIVRLMREGDEYGPADDELLRKRLFVTSRVSVDNLLTTTVNGVLVRTEMTERILRTAEQIPELKLIVLDPVSRFRGGDENSNEGATRFVEAIEAIPAATGATILLPHHVSKDGLRAGAERLSIENLRGASALADAVRWAAAMATFRKDAAANYGIGPEEAGRYVRFDIVKNNYGAPWPGMWLRRERGGVLAPATLEHKRKARDEQRAESRYSEILPKLQGLVRQHQENGEPLTKNRLREFAGKAGIFGVGDQTLRGIVERAIAEGAIKSHPKPGGKNRAEELRTS